MTQVAIASKPRHSTPGFSEFSPESIEWQDIAVDEILHQYDYSLGAHEVLMSGTVGSGKSMPAAHIAVYICLKYPGARGAICRRTLGDLRETFYQKIKEHLSNCPMLKEGVHYWLVDSTCTVRFANGSKIIARTWHDGDHEKMRSLDLTFVVFEEAIEMEDEDKGFAEETLLRLGRTTHIPIALAIYITNPGSPEHWLYEHFRLDLDEDPEYRDQADLSERPATKHVYYSMLDDNGFLPKWYGDQVSRGLPPKMAERLRRGRWIAIAEKVIYYEYKKQVHYRSQEYAIREDLPIRFSWDFNIGEGKPMSVIAFQYDPAEDTFHFFDEVIINGMRTAQSCEELAARGYFDVPGRHFVIHGDATGKHRDTRNNKSDWDIIKKFFANLTVTRDDGKEAPISWEFKVPLSNPQIRKRHNIVNAYLRNDLDEVRCYFYAGTPIADKGMRLTKLKKGSQIQEDDSKDYQHVTTAVGYGIYATIRGTDNKEQGTVAM